MEDRSESDKVVNDDSKKYLQKTFKSLRRKIVLEVFTKDGVNTPYNRLTVKFVRELSEISDKIEARFYDLADERAKEMNVTRSPTILVDPGRYQIRYTGAPAGEEGRSFTQTIVLVSSDDSELTPKAREILKGLAERRHIQVFVTAACPYCPGEVINANRAAIERPDLIVAECVESAENTDLARQFNVGSVPQTVINGKTISIGLQGEEMFVSSLLTLRPAQPPTKAKSEDEIVGDFDVIIVGAGPAGLTAAIYASRSGLKPMILEKSVPGGQVVITPFVENWPGTERIAGRQLMDMMLQHAKQYAHIHDGEEVIEIKIGKRIEALTTAGKYLGNVLIIATGATHRKLGVPGEDRLYGKGVSYCATCDGYIYRGKRIVVVGGGNTALTDALYLSSLGANVMIIHRRGEFRAEKRLIDTVLAGKIEVIWNSVVDEIQGKDVVEGIVLHDIKSGKRKKLEADAVFVAIGEIPVSGLASSIGIETDEAGFVIVDREQRTNIPRVYAAGDVTGGVRQIVTAAGSGAVSALTAFKDISQMTARKSAD